MNEPCKLGCWNDCPQRCPCECHRPPAPIPDRPETGQVACNICGAVVVDTSKHASFHRNLLVLLLPETPQAAENLDNNIHFTPIS